MKPFHRRQLSGMGVALWLLLSGCASLPEAEVLQFVPSAETYVSQKQIGLPRIWDEVIQACADGEARVGLLEHGDEALVARVNLIRSARKNIRIQTFIWAPDETGRWLVWELIRAVKQRGITAELLIDQMFTEQDPDFLAFLCTVDPKLQVKLYNPNLNRLQPSTFDTLFDLATDFRRVNVRMHNKVMIVDDRVVITGGRNLSNSYFDRSLGLNYKDRDILVVHPDCEEIVSSFKDYWRSDWAVPAAELLDVAETLEESSFSKYETKGEFDLRGLFADADKKASDPVYLRKTFIDVLMAVDDVKWIFDDPKKEGAIDPAKGPDIAGNLGSLVNTARKSVLIQSPYVVLSDRARRLFASLKEARPEVEVVVSTNSLAATDSWLTYAANFKEKRVYLQDLGFELWEFKPIPDDIHEMMAYDKLLTRRPTPDEAENPPLAEFRTPRNLPLFSIRLPDGRTVNRSSRSNDYLGTIPYLCLHGKSLIVDNELSYVGSYNLDPRSGSYNTEVGLVVRDSEFALELRRVIEQDIAPRNSYLIGIKKGLPVLRSINLLFYRISEELPLFDPWPFRYASSFELRPGKSPVGIYHTEFYKNWNDLGSFPLLGYFGRKHMAARLFKATGMIFKPLL